MTPFACARRQLLRALLAGSFTPAAAQAVPKPSRRIALVVGNGAYQSLPLRNAREDARAMSTTLSGLGFEVDAREDLDWDGFVTALASFTRQARDSDVRLLYYAGHGMQVDGRNYLNPVGPLPASEHDLRAKAVDVDVVITTLSHLDQGVSIVIVDACRSNPFLGAVRVTRSGRASAGVGDITAPRGTVVAFATGPDGIAEDGLGARHSSFTRHLLQDITHPGQPIETLFKRVRSAVVSETARAQQPWFSTNLVGDFCFVARGDGGCGPV